ncbi:hypothetical protein SAMN05443668_101448 [Cryptosporangium aurantiacum]|uniref:Uncharacterized protein n=1 Tax=Cryptosporangium aurantiacum TaxID=134849 RepID=A0A1M7IBD3_9ACTN|nr:hypothetical protein SAMN05443668_101448 [Cryptosporangium aurantiacum]
MKSPLCKLTWSPPRAALAVEGADVVASGFPS